MVWRLCDGYRYWAPLGVEKLCCGEIEQIMLVLGCEISVGGVDADL